jgi:hypothetical protein
MLWFFLFFLWIMLIFHVIGDVFTSGDLSGLAKAMWTIFIIFLPFLGIFVYLIARGDEMTQHRIDAMRAQESAVQDYIRSSAGATSAADQLQSLADLHTAGKLTDDEFTAAKNSVINA